MLDYKDIAKIFEEMELRLIASLKRNLSRHKAEEQKEGFKWSAWQAEKLKNIDKFRKENTDILGEYVDVIDEETRQLMIEQFREGEQVAEQSVIEASEKVANIPDTPTAIPGDHFFGVNTPKMKRLMDDITTLEKTVETAAVRNMDDVYRTTVNKAQLMMNAGELTLTKAIDLATREFLDKGINCIVYADGRRVNIADYVRMALRTTSTRAKLQGEAKRFAELGYDTVLVSQYGKCSETCEPWQGRAYIDDVFTIWNGEISGDLGKSHYCGKWFTRLSVAIRGGLFHPNCRHTMGQYIEGLTDIPKPIPAEKIKEQRELEQKQRAMERSIRALRRKIEGTQDEQKVKEYRRTLKNEIKELDKFVEEHDDILIRDESREDIYSGEGKPKQSAPRTEEASVKATDTESKNPVPTDKEPYVSKPENNENTMNFVQPEPVKTVQSNEETDDTPTAVVSDEAVETAETAENVQETVKQPVETVTDSEESVQNFTDDTVDNSDESDIIEEETVFEPLSADTVVPVLREDSKEWINSLSPEEIRAIKKYTKNSGDPKDDKFYARLNSMLRGDIPEDDTLKYYSDVISGAISKFELKYDIICYRSVKHNPVEGMKIGDIYEPKQFVSTAVVSSRTLKGDYNIVIIAKKGSNGAYIELLSKYPNQREFLFDKNLKYRILKIRNNKIVLEVII